jgi:putative membrane protein
MRGAFHAREFEEFTMTHALPRTLLAVLALAISFGTVAADKKAGGKLSNDDRQFITQAAQDGMAEVQLGKLAQQKGSSAGVKQFGQRMVDDHGKANKELESIASKLGATPPKTLDQKHQETMKKFEKLSGAEFDREYAQAMAQDHEKAVSLFEKQSKSGDADELKKFAAKHLPTLQEHLKMARGLTDKK